jgi:putative acetyltransferase
MTSVKFMRVRTHRNGDIPHISRLYYDTIHFVNCNDYTREQIDAWAPTVPKDSFWRDRFKKYNVYVAEEGRYIVGFTELDAFGHIDCFFVHHQWQRQGVGTCLMDRVIAAARRKQIARLFAEVSITARPFFTNRGFSVVKENQVIRGGVKLEQYSMERWLSG